MMKMKTPLNINAANEQILSVRFNTMIKFTICFVALNESQFQYIQVLLLWCTKT